MVVTTPELTRQNACHFYWNNGPPKEEKETWLYDALSPEDLLRSAHGCGATISFGEMCDVLTNQPYHYTKYCLRWDVVGSKSRLVDEILDPGVK